MKLLRSEANSGNSCPLPPLTGQAHWGPNRVWILDENIIDSGCYRVRIFPGDRCHNGSGTPKYCFWNTVDFCGIVIINEQKEMPHVCCGIQNKNKRRDY
jgi:hypothetical protein